MKRHKSVSMLTDFSDIVNNKTSKYCLTTHSVDPDGDLETCLYKGDVVPTAGDGAQVLFNDVEILQHKSPQTSPLKNNSPMSGQISSPREVIEDRCAMAIEGHPRRSYKTGQMLSPRDG